LSTTDQVDVAPLPILVHRWRRFGHDRAYVKVDGVDIGYRDLRTGEVRCLHYGHSDVILRATAGLSPRSAGPPPAPVQVYPLPSARPEHADRDLSLNVAGAATRARALELRSQAPVRTVIARAFGIKTEERNWRIGADGEEAVAVELAKLGPAWRVLHAIPVGSRGSDIDHLVIGPAGVFTINTKNHPDANIWVHGETFKVNGLNQYYVRNSRHEALRAAQVLTAQTRLEVDVRAIIAVMGASHGFTVKSQPEDGAVTVMSRRNLTGHLRELPWVLDAARIEAVYATARRLSTWQSSGLRPAASATSQPAAPRLTLASHAASPTPGSRR
jgi:hypothetical protein